MLEIHRLTQERWADFERLFESRGTLRGCWCMIFRASVHSELPTPDGPSRRAEVRRMAEEMISLFQAQDVHREALFALLRSSYSK